MKRLRELHAQVVHALGALGLTPEVTAHDGWLDVHEGLGHALRYQTAHGPYEVGLLEDDRQASVWIALLRRLADAVRHRDGPRAASAAPAINSAKQMVALATLVFSVLACGAASHDPQPRPPAPLAASAAVVPTTVAAPVPTSLPLSEEPANAATSVTIIEDDLPRALALATDAGKALFVEVWAPWCHTCLSMKSFVLPDAAVLPLAERVIFAAIDSDRPEGSEFVERYQVDVWPTLYVLDPRDETVLGMWQGAASVEELRDFINDAVDARDAAVAPDGPLAVLLEAKRAHARGKFLVAARHYRRAIERGGEGWRRRSEAIHGLVFSEYKQGHWGRCVELGEEHLATVEGAALPADLASVVLSCSRRVLGPALRKRGFEVALERLERHTREPPAGASVDDRSDALASYSGALAETGDRRGAVEALLRELTLLERAAVEAPEPAMAATFDYARMNAYFALGRGRLAVTMLRERVTQLPDSYEPWARLATAHHKLGQAREAGRAIARAVALSYGPRRLGYLDLQARLHHQLGEVADERKALEALIAGYQALDDTQRRHPARRKMFQRARQRLAQLPTASSAT